MQLPEIKDQITIRLTEDDKAALRVVMQHDAALGLYPNGKIAVGPALKAALHRNAKVIRERYM